MYSLFSLLTLCLAFAAPVVFATVLPPCCTNTVPISTATISATVTVPTTITITTGAVSTSYVFLPGNPPATAVVPRARRGLKLESGLEDTVEKRGSCNADDCLRALRGHTGAPFCATYTTATYTATTGLPTYIPAECNPSRISSACSCLTSTSTTTTTTATTSCSCPVPPIPTVTVTATVTTTATVTVPAPPSLSTVYPCASPLPSPGPSYGDYADSNDLGLSNTLQYLSSPQGASASACCNACLFEIPNCVQAYFYSYEGCVISQATNLASASGMGISNSCPAGTFHGLSYGPDVDPAFRSTGNIIGPCGQQYTNF